MARHRRKKHKSLGRADLTPRQALTQAEIASENGDCVRAWSRFKEAQAADAHDRRMIGEDRFAEVKRAISRCKMQFSGARRWRA
jgi:uncharacterized protein YbaA (DUF1428 family)